MKSLLISALTLPFIACGSAPKPAPVAPEPPPPPPPEAPLPTLSGDDQVPERFQKTFRTWLKDDVPGVYSRVVEVREVSNAVAVVLERRIEMGGECRVGPSTLDIIHDEGKEPEISIEHFGDDCCPGTTCAMAPLSWHLRYIKAVADKDLAALSLLVSAKKKLAYRLVTPDGKSKKTYGKKDIAAGKLMSPPGCGFVDTRPSCGDPNPKTGAFQCACHGGGYHVTYDWVKEGDGFALVAIDEQSD